MASLGGSSQDFTSGGPFDISASGAQVNLGDTQQRTNVTKDPWQDFLYNTILSKNQDAYVPKYTKDALQNFTENPAVAAGYFPQLAQPLLAAARRGEAVQQTDLTDMFRKAGGVGGGSLQSGAFAQAARNLIADQGVNEQNLLASQYAPLTAQLSNNVNNAITAGLKFPQANNTAISNLIPLVTSLRPVSTSTETMSASTGTGSPYAPSPNLSWLDAPATLNNPGTYNQYYG